MRLDKDEFIKHYVNPIGVDFINKKLEIKDIIVFAQTLVLSFGEHFYISTKWYKNAIGAILIYDITNRDSFNSIKLWLRDVRQHADSKVVIMLIGSKCDLNENREVSTEEAIEYSKKENIIFYETSSLKNINIYEAFATLITKIFQILNNDQQPKQTIEQLPKPNGPNHICNFS